MSPRTTASFCLSSTASMRSFQADADAVGAWVCCVLSWFSSARSALSSLRSSSKSLADWARAPGGRLHRPAASRVTNAGVSFMVTPLGFWGWCEGDGLWISGAHAANEGPDAVIARVVEESSRRGVVGNAALGGKKKASRQHSAAEHHPRSRANLIVRAAGRGRRTPAPRPLRAVGGAGGGGGVPGGRGQVAFYFSTR